jgi:hypothetical protein
MKHGRDITKLAVTLLCYFIAACVDLAAFWVLGLVTTSPYVYFAVGVLCCGIEILITNILYKKWDMS